MCKLLLTVIGHVLGRVSFDDTSQTHDQGGPDGNSGSIQSPSNRTSPIGLLRTVTCVFNQGVELMIRSVAKKLAAYIDEQVSKLPTNDAFKKYVVLMNLISASRYDGEQCWANVFKCQILGTSGWEHYSRNYEVGLGC